MLRQQYSKKIYKIDLIAVYGSSKKLQQTAKSTFGPGTHFPYHYTIKIWILWASRYALIKIQAATTYVVASQFKFSINQSLQCCRAHETYAVKACAKVRSDDQKMNHDKMTFSLCWKLEWKSSDEMDPKILRQPNLTKVDLPWKDMSVSPLINIHTSIKAIHESIIDIMEELPIVST